MDPDCICICCPCTCDAGLDGFDDDTEDDCACGRFGCGGPCDNSGPYSDDDPDEDDWLHEPDDFEDWNDWRIAIRAERAAKPNHGSRNARRKAQRTRDLQAARRRHRRVYGPRGCSVCGAGPGGPCKSDCPDIPF